MIDMKEEKVEFYNDKNQKLVGLLSLPDRENPPITIIIHGFKGTKEYYPFVNNSIKPLTDAGIAILRIDCRGSGESDLEFKDMSIKTEAEDVLTAIDFVKTLDIDSNKIALIGISMGATAIILAMKNKPNIKTIVFWGPAFYYSGKSHYNTPENRKTVEEEGIFYVKATLTGKVYTAGKELFKEITSLDSRPYMKFVKIPALILRGSKDEIVGLSKDEEVSKLLNAEYKLIEKGDHNFTDKDSEKELIKSTINWFNKWLK